MFTDYFPIALQKVHDTISLGAALLRRKALIEINEWETHKTTQGLLVTGARQVGKTYLIRDFARTHYKNFVEMNLIDNPSLAKVLDDARSSGDLMSRIALMTRIRLVPRETLIFIDEVQVCKNVVTAIKFLVENNEYDFILSGSLLGVELRDIRSVPVGYLDVVEMFPLDFEEFCWASGIGEDILEGIRDAFKNRIGVPDYVHDEMMRVFHEYLIVGGMPRSVASFVESRNAQEVRRIQKNIRQFNRKDISQYAGKDVLVIKSIYESIPSQLNQENKRFEFKSLGESVRYTRYENRFLWLIDAGVALPCYQVSEPRSPLLLARESNRFKLYMNDIGLLTSTYGRREALALFERDSGLNYGSTFENVIAQELASKGRSLYYYSRRKFGEVDFVLDDDFGQTILMEIKSGKWFRRHVTLSKLLEVPDYSISDAIVMCEDNVRVEGQITYLPIYMMFCLGEDRDGRFAFSSNKV
jgi:predicted AAA+ superfamily ATPase